MLGKDSFQEVDIAGVVMPVTKHSFIVKNIHELANTIRRAFKIAQTGRPGPVLVDITKDVTAAKADYTPKKPEAIKRVTETIKDEDIETAIDMINHAERPYFLVGGGVTISGASAELAKRKAAWTPREPKVTTGYLARYASMVTSGNRGAILEIPRS